jgi:hypothetical protein
MKAALVQVQAAADDDGADKMESVCPEIEDMDWFAVPKEDIRRRLRMFRDVLKSVADAGQDIPPASEADVAAPGPKQTERRASAPTLPRAGGAARISDISILTIEDGEMPKPSLLARPRRGIEALFHAGQPP